MSCFEYSGLSKCKGYINSDNVFHFSLLRFLRGTCKDNEKCVFSHKVDPSKVMSKTFYQTLLIQQRSILTLIVPVFYYFTYLYLSMLASFLTDASLFVLLTG